MKFGHFQSIVWWQLIFFHFLSTHNRMYSEWVISLISKPISCLQISPWSKIKTDVRVTCIRGISKCLASQTFICCLGKLGAFRCYLERAQVFIPFFCRRKAFVRLGVRSAWRAVPLMTPWLWCGTWSILTTWCCRRAPPFTSFTRTVWTLWASDRALTAPPADSTLLLSSLSRSTATPKRY